MVGIDDRFFQVGGHSILVIRLVARIQTEFGVALPVTPLQVQDEIDGARRHFEHRERCIFCDIIRQELTDAERIGADQAAASQKRMKLMARIMAEALVAPMFRGIFKTLTDYCMEALSFRLNGRFVQYDPQNWRDQYDMTINVGIGTDGAAVVEVLEDLQTLLDDAVRLLALDVGHEAHAARVMFIGGRVQAVFLQVADFGGRGHGNSFANFHGTAKNSAAQQDFKAV